MQNNSTHIRWGIAGLGKVAHRFAADLTNFVNNATLHAVAARDSGKADEFAQQHGCPSSYGSYEELARDNDVDVVYVAVIHPFHRQLVELFLTHGKHVLVEKPAFTNLKDWDDMAALAADKGLLLTEAMKFAAFPAYRKLSEFIAEKDITFHSIKASFGELNEFDIRSPLFSRELCGGATLDVGVYGLWLYHDLCRLAELPVDGPADATLQEHPKSSVDQSAVFSYCGPVKGLVSASIVEDLNREALILGEDLEIRIREKWWNPKTVYITWKGEQHTIHHPGAGGGFEHEIEHVSRLIRNKASCSPILRHDVSRQVIRAMEAGLSRNGFEHLLRAC